MFGHTARAVLSSATTPLLGALHQTLPKRDESSNVDIGNPSQFPVWLIVLIVLNVIAFLPVVAFCTYTLGQLVPALAFAEDDSQLDYPPAYEPVADQDIEFESKGQKKGSVDAEAAAGNAPVRRQPITSDVRATLQHIRTVGGSWRACYHGLFLSCLDAFWLSLGFLSIGTQGSAIVPSIVVSMLGTWLLSTAWTHQVVAAQGSGAWKYAFKNLKTTFKATALPSVLCFVASYFANIVPYSFVGLGAFDPAGSTTAPLTSVLVLVLVFMLQAGLVVPASVVLTRVQVSMLPDTYRTIVPIKCGALDSTNSRGYMTVGEAWKSISRASWIRILKMFLKLIALFIAIEFMLTGIIIAETFLVTVVMMK
ncbi:hypothetical protein F4780DRAFT_779583 [Xylariomycetidae sp. FL0641]|nr:hypothetical protein F4780DRAFT_779583 [Xylariomycetidae sp. FL0641]